MVWIDGGLHASETVGAQQLIETVYQLLTRSDDETMRLLDDAIHYAEQGIVVTRSQSTNTQKKLAELKDVPGFAARFLVDGETGDMDLAGVAIDPVERGSVAARVQSSVSPHRLRRHVDGQIAAIEFDQISADQIEGLGG